MHLIFKILLYDSTSFLAKLEHILDKFQAIFGYVLANLTLKNNEKFWKKEKSSTRYWTQASWVTVLYPYLRAMEDLLKMEG